MEIRWSPEARRDLLEIVIYGREHGISSAELIPQRIYDRVGNLARFPLSGRVGRVSGTRELVLTGLPFVAVYRVQEEVVQIVRILHGARRWP